MKISVADTKAQLVKTLDAILTDWNNHGFISSLASYCGGKQEFPYSQLRKLESMGLIQSFSKTKRNKTYKWMGGENPDLDEIAFRVINFAGKEIGQSPRVYVRRDIDMPIQGMGFRRGGNFLEQAHIGLKPVPENQIKNPDLTTLTVQITLILQKNDIPESKIPAITNSILSLLK